MANYSLVTDFPNSTEQPGEEDKFLYLNDIRRGLLFVALPIIVLVGTLGNSCALLVLFRRRMRAKSIYFYLAVLACADTTVLFMSAFKHWLRMLTGFEFLHVSSGSCKLLIFIILCSQHISAWLIVFLTFDRFLSIWQPFSAAAYCTVRRARQMTVGLVAVTCLYNSHVFWTFQLFPREPRPMCTIDTNSSFYYMFDYLKTITYFILPSVIVLFLNACIIFKVKVKSKFGAEGHESDLAHGSQAAPIMRRKNRVTRMLLIISFVWIALTTPYGVVSLSRSLFVGYSPSLVRFIITVCFILFYVNHSVNFFLYCLTGKKIREEFVNLFRHICHCNRKSGGQSSVQRTQKTLRTPQGGVEVDQGRRSRRHLRVQNGRLECAMALMENNDVTPPKKNSSDTS